MLRNRLGFALILIGGLVLAAPASWAATSPSAGFVKTLADQVLAIFNDRRLSSAEQEQRLHVIALRDFDVPYSARFVLGPYWKAASDSERADFTTTFQDYIVHVYAGEFSIYHDVDFNLLSERVETPTQILVHSEIVRHDGRRPVRVDWRIAAAANSYKIVDVTIEGISELVTLREQFTEAIGRDQGGVATLTQRLREKTHS